MISFGNSNDIPMRCNCLTDCIKVAGGGFGNFDQRGGSLWPQSLGKASRGARGALALPRWWQFKNMHNGIEWFIYLCSLCMYLVGSRYIYIYIDIPISSGITCVTAGECSSLVDVDGSIGWAKKQWLSSGSAVFLATRPGCVVVG